MRNSGGGGEGYSGIASGLGNDWIKRIEMLESKLDIDIGKGGAAKSMDRGDGF